MSIVCNAFFDNNCTVPKNCGQNPLSNSHAEYLSDDFESLEYPKVILLLD